MEYLDYVESLRPKRAELAAAFAPFHTLENVLGWMRERRLPLGDLDVIFQDEYAHDVIIPLGDGGEHLVFGIT